MVYTRSEILKYLEERKGFFRSDFNIVKIGIFGSYATETQTENSNIDIILEFENYTPDIFDKKFELREYLSKQFDKEVDICRVGAIKPIFREYILSEAIFV